MNKKGKIDPHQLRESKRPGVKDKTDDQPTQGQLETQRRLLGKPKINKRFVNKDGVEVVEHAAEQVVGHTGKNRRTQFIVCCHWYMFNDDTLKPSEPLTDYFAKRNCRCMAMQTTAKKRARMRIRFSAPVVRAQRDMGKFVSKAPELGMKPWLSARTQTKRELNCIAGSRIQSHPYVLMFSSKVGKHNGRHKKKLFILLQNTCNRLLTQYCAYRPSTPWQHQTDFKSWISYDV